MIKLKIYYTNDSGDGMKLNFEGSQSKAIPLLDLLIKHIKNTTEMQQTIEEIIELDVKAIR